MLFGRPTSGHTRAFGGIFVPGAIAVSEENLRLSKDKFYIAYNSATAQKDNTKLVLRATPGQVSYIEFALGRSGSRSIHKVNQLFVSSMYHKTT